MSDRHTLLKVSGDNNNFTDCDANGLVEVTGKKNKFLRFSISSIIRESIRTKVFWFAVTPVIMGVLIGVILLAIEYGFFIKNAQ